MKQWVETTRMPAWFVTLVLLPSAITEFLRDPYRRASLVEGVLELVLLLVGWVVLGFAAIAFLLLIRVLPG